MRIKVVELAKNNKALEGLNGAALTAIHRHCSPRTVREGESVFREGSKTHELWLVEKGCVCLQSDNLETQRQFRSNASAGDFFGELTLLGFPHQPVSAVAAEESQLVVLDCLAVEKLLHEVPIPFLQNLSRGSIQRLQSSNSASLRDIEIVLGGIVHDLKNPIGNAMNAAELIDAVNVIDDQTRRTLANGTGLVKRSCTRMLALVQDVLDATRGKTNLRIETVQVESLLTELEELILSRIRARGVTVITQKNFNGKFRGDSRATARALANIIKNAGEAMQSGGKLTIATSEVSGHVAFRISDTGSGIPPQVLSGLFDPLVTYGKEGGSGFGMTITRMIAEGHGGLVRLVETSERGTTFEMHLPLTEQDVQPSCRICGKPGRLVSEFPSTGCEPLVLRCPEHEREDDYT